MIRMYLFKRVSFTCRCAQYSSATAVKILTYFHLFFICLSSSCAQRIKDYNTDVRLCDINLRMYTHAYKRTNKQCARREWTLPVDAYVSSAQSKRTHTGNGAESTCPILQSRVLNHQSSGMRVWVCVCVCLCLWMFLYILRAMMIWSHNVLAP